jgi:aldehyde oxidoreductase
MTMWQEYIRASSVEQALQTLARWQGQARIIAGGTDLVLNAREGKEESPACAIDITTIPGIDAIEEEGDWIVVGAGVTFHNLWTSELVNRHGHVLAEAARSVGAWAIQNMGTLGGNVVTALPAGDGSIALLALGAEAEVARLDGRRWVAVSSLFAGQGQSKIDPTRELITRFRWRKPGARQSSAYERIAKRETMALPIACCGVDLQLTEDLEHIAWARIALGPVAETPFRAICAEDALRGAACEDAAYVYASEQAAYACTLRTSRLRATKEYREQVVEVLFQRALKRAVETARAGASPSVAGRFHSDWSWSGGGVPGGTGETVTFFLNGAERTLPAQPGATLAQVLREDLHLTGTKVSCDEGDCGACTVLVDGQAVVSCLYPLHKAHGRHILTIEGVAREGKLHPVQEAFIRHDAIQCGFCTPGMVLAALALLEKVPEPSPEEIKRALGNNYCRCTGYVKIVQAIQDAGAVLSGARPALSGRAVPRKDAVRRVTGEEVYAADAHLEGMLHGKIVWSNYPHARIVRVDTTAAEAVPGVVRILTYCDVTGKNLFGSMGYDQPVFAEDRVLFLGEAVAVVLAETLAAAEEGARQVHVEYETLPVIATARDALRVDAPVLKGEDNVFHRTRVVKGDVAAGFAMADVVVENDYATQPVEHAFLETESGFAVVEDGVVTVYQATQYPAGDRQQLADVLGLPLDRVRVVQTPVGGAFGGKMDITIQPFLALGAYLTGRPVKIVLTRPESIRMHVKRHPYWLHYKLGATRDGRLVAMEATLLADGGAYRSTTDDVLEQATVFSSGPYAIPNVLVTGKAVRTNNVSSGAMRGFGANQVCFAMESLMDELAHALGMDPFELRRRNVLEVGSELVTGQVLRHSIGARQVLEAAEVALKKSRLPAPRPGKRIGVGVAAGTKNVGIGIGADDSVDAAMELLPDGILFLRHGAVDLGQGSNTVMCQIAARTMGVHYDLVQHITGDTTEGREGGITAASRQTFVTGRAVMEAATLFKARLIEYAAEVYGVRPERLLLTEEGQFIDLENERALGKLADVAHRAAERGEQVAVFYHHAPQTTYRILSDERRQELGLDQDSYINYPALCYVCQVAVVEVDEETGHVDVLKVIAAHDAGVAINRTAIEGQIEGAVFMGLGYALTEEFVQDGGWVVSDSLHKIALPRSTLPTEVVPLIVEDPDPGGPFGAKGLAEAGAVPTAPAICNAIYDAVGVRIRELPATKDKVVAGLLALD